MSNTKRKFIIFSFLVGIVAYTLTPDTLGDVRVEGEVLRAYPDYFLLTNEEGLTLVEMDDVEAYSETINLIAGDRVVVKGELDRNLDNDESLAAKSVLVKNLNVLYHLDPSDEEGVADFYSDFENDPTTDNLSTFDAEGVVKSIKGDLLVLKTSNRESVSVNLSTLICCQPNEVEMVELAVGDRIGVAGRLKKRMFEPDILMASNLLIYKY
jgi:hypothetical protein